MRENTYITIQSWMRTELNLSGNELLVYAVIYGFSQDGESRFTGSRQYIADWCGCTTRNVQNILNNLTENGLLTKYERVVNNVKQCEYVANFTSSEKISLGGDEKISPNNIETDTIGVNTNTINSISITDTDISDSHAYSADELKRDFLGSAGKSRTHKPVRKKNLFEKCSDEILAYTKNIKLQSVLRSYLSLRLSNKDKPLYNVNQWICMLNHLSDISGESALDSSVDKRVTIVNKSIVGGWLSFYPLHDSTRSPAGELGNVVCDKSEVDVVDEKF